jgi:hypothetical protein
MKNKSSRLKKKKIFVAQLNAVSHPELFSIHNTHCIKMHSIPFIIPSFLSLEDFYNRHCLRRAHSILRDSSHPAWAELGGGFRD